MHTLFNLEETQGLVASRVEGRVAILLDIPDAENTKLYKLLEEWADQADKCRAGEITKEQYDQWR